jgi:SNW domain-containing protein 1
MAALASALPAPIYTPIDEQSEGPILPPVAAANIPKYGQRKGWKPKVAADFGAGGAYPEVSHTLALGSWTSAERHLGVMGIEC